MKIPGSAWLEFQLIDVQGIESTLVQTAYFVPRGLAGYFYWYFLYPIHLLVFRTMLRELVKRAEHSEPEVISPHRSLS
jgi:hypothetical protein